MCLFCHIVPFPNSHISLFCQSSVEPHFYILPCHLSYQITFTQYGKYCDNDIKTNCPKLPEVFVKMALLLFAWTKKR